MQIQREGNLSFVDAGLAIWEEGISDARAASGMRGAAAWEKQFKRDVFKRIIQTLNRLGWTVGPDLDAEKNYKIIAHGMRWCVKGRLKADLQVSGRSITLKMFQNVNAPDRADHDGRYQSDKEKHMPYVMWLEMERTRRKIRDYLCAVFTGYKFTAREPQGMGPGVSTALEAVERHHASHRNKGRLADFSTPQHSYKSKDGDLLQHGQKVWVCDRKGRVLPGTAYYNSGQMWWVVTSRYSYTNLANSEIWTKNPGDLRRKRNEWLRRKRMEAVMSSAVGRMDFKRAETLKNILFPPQESLYMIWTDRHGGAYFGPNYSGYTTDTNSAGKYTRSELRPYLGDADEKDHLRAVPVRKAA
jgi:hypothetical protein